MPSEVEHGQGDERFGMDKAEGDASEESNLGVHGFDESVGQAMFDCGKDLFAMGADTALERDERFDAATSCPLDPPLKRFSGLVDGELEDCP